MRSATVLALAAVLGLTACNSRSLDVYTPVSLVDFLDACAGGRESPLCAPMKSLLLGAQGEFVTLHPSAPGLEVQEPMLRRDYAAVVAGSPTPVTWDEFVREVSRSNILRTASLNTGSYLSLAGETVEVQCGVRPEFSPGACQIGDLLVYPKYDRNPNLRGVYAVIDPQRPVTQLYRLYLVPEIYRAYLN